uniref:Transcription initiation factor IIA subunit 2 n=1 Tax=Steinernema glaseri TaxID=37863 RepID=A0A1I7ZUL6_9BILA
MAYQMYRSTTLGDALQSTLDDFVADGQIPRNLANIILRVFDVTFADTLTTRASNRITFKAEKLRVYRFCDNVWTFLLEDVDFRDMYLRVTEPVDRLKIVACDGRPPVFKNPLQCRK